MKMKRYIDVNEKYKEHKEEKEKKKDINRSEEIK